MRTFIFAILSCCLLTVVGCKEVALVEQLHNIPKAQWAATQTDTFRFAIQDTTVAYKVSVVVRHTNLYPYRNLWVRVGMQQPGQDSLRKQEFNLPLAAADSWLGIGMGDIFEVRPLLFKSSVRFPASGEVLVTLQHIMRQNPLPGVMQVGVRVEPE